MKILVNSQEHLETIMEHLSEKQFKELGILNGVPVICPPIKEFPTTINISIIIGTEENNLLNKVLKWLRNIK